MSASSGSIFQRGRASSKLLTTLYDAEGNEIEPEAREDVEQNVKLQESIELLVAAGYFRARIKGLSPFDKVVGGMTWCITTCNFDIDVDLLFQENSTIGQKIALTEKIVAVLPKMQCPHNIEPHQIQGLDFIHIYPVIQWLVKKAIETREEMGDYIRAYSISQFNKKYNTPEDELFKQNEVKAINLINEIKDLYKPQRQYRRQDALKIKEEETRVQSTLLEYGRRYGFSRSSKVDKDESLVTVKKSAPGMERKQSIDPEDEEKKITAILSELSATRVQEGKLTASSVGSIVGLQSDEIQEIASKYADKQSELIIDERGDRLGGTQHHKRIVASLNKQIQQQESKLEEVQKRHQERHKQYLEIQQKFQESQEYSSKIEANMEKLEELELSKNQSTLQKLRSLVALNESLKKQEQEFRVHCKEEMSNLQANIEQLKAEGDEGQSEDQERSSLIEKQYQADKDKLHKIRLLLARKNRDIASLQRKIDEVPSRAELGQYQRRFVELYNQVAAKHKETKQFYTLYNTLDDTKLYLAKEVSLLNSIHDNFEQAMSSTTSKEQFLKQFEQIVEGIKQNRTKVEKKKQEEKMRRDQLNDTYLDLVEKQRLYFKTVKDFKEECRKNELLLAKVKGLTNSEENQKSELSKF